MSTFHRAFPCTRCTQTARPPGPALKKCTVRQGAGRLIRSETDRGVFMLCDSRVAEKFYGKKVLSSLPDFYKTRRLEKALEFFLNPEAWHAGLYC